MTETSQVILTNRLQLDPLREIDAEEMVDVLSHLELYEFTGGDPPTLDELTRRYRSMIAGPGDGDGDERWLNWIAREVKGGRAVGFVQATVIDDTAEVAWLIGRAFQRNGYGTEATAALCSWLSSNGAESLTANIHPDHVASQRVAAAVGMKRSGEVDEDGEEIWVSSG